NGQSSTDYGYFSFVAYTSLGFGDITPKGPVRFMTALETLTGLILIAWTASFIFLQMQVNWEHRQTNKKSSS
ncbi:MAG: two pore domain potassium channel family protein, partial [Planctomycetaceae bacterium]|nr:two pore domain potassium channel family protein [Planctomycetaceae bacterium]